MHASFELMDTRSISSRSLTSSPRISFLSLDQQKSGSRNHGFSTNHRTAVAQSQLNRLATSYFVSDFGFARVCLGFCRTLVSQTLQQVTGGFHVWAFLSFPPSLFLNSDMERSLDQTTSNKSKHLANRQLNLSAHKPFRNCCFLLSMGLLY
jgi:hypothetical protein